MKKHIGYYEKEGWKGSDLSLAVSLFEYGMIWKEHTQPAETVFIYGINPISAEHRLFDYAWLDPKMNLRTEYDWVDWDQFFSYLHGGDQSFYLRRKNESTWFNDRPFVYQIYDLVGYYGYEEIFGSTYFSAFEIEGG